MSDHHRPPILIVGGGIIGLTLAQALRDRSIPYLVFERDFTASQRGPGWALSIHWAKSILELLLPNSIFNQLPKAYVNPGAVRNNEKGAFVHYDALTASPLFRVPPSERVRLRREAFRDILLSDIDIKWSKKFSAFTKRDDGTVIAHFEDGSSSPPGSLILGCDGARSMVRKILLPESFVTKGLPVRCLGVTVAFPSSQARKMLALDPYFMQMGDQQQNVFVFFSFLDVPEQDTSEYACQVFMSWPENSSHEVPEDPSERVALMKDFTRDWAEPFHSVIQAIPADSVPITVRLEDWAPHVWGNHDGAVTLAGDSAHAMTMYRGEGFNQGLADLKDLVQKLEELYKSEENLLDQRKTLIDAYEESMRRRTYPAVLASRRACLDAHDQQRINDRSPLVAMRAMTLDDLKE